MQFEFDPQKSAVNKDKHGIDFVEAQLLWQDAGLIDVAAGRDREPRYMAIGKIDGKHWSAVWVYRAQSIRLISVRRSRKQEVQLYERVRT